MREEYVCGVAGGVFHDDGDEVNDRGVVDYDDHDDSNDSDNVDCNDGCDFVITAIIGTLRFSDATATRTSKKQ